MLTFHAVSFSYVPGTPVLDSVDLAVPAGLTLVLGPNGCGKSTLLKLGAGVERPERGTVLVEGHDLWREEVAARAGLVYIPEHPDLSPYASVREILLLVCGLRGHSPAAADEALESVGLSGHRRHSVRELSLGQRRRAVLAAALIGRPRVAVLDEPLEALDRAARALVVDWVAGLLAGGAAVVVATHDLEPFVPLARGAVAVVPSGLAIMNHLPDDPGVRLAMCERLSRGLGF